MFIKDKQGSTSEYNSQITIKELNNETKIRKQEISIIKNNGNQFDKRITKLEDKSFIENNIIEENNLLETSNNTTK